MPHLGLTNGVGYTATADEVIAIGDAGPDSVASFLVFIHDVANTIAITPKGRPVGSSVASADYATLSYKKLVDDSTVAGTTPISANGAYLIKADGMEVFLDFDETSSGTCVIHVRPFRG